MTHLLGSYIIVYKLKSFRTLRVHLSRWLWKTQPSTSTALPKKSYISDSRPVVTMPTTLFFYPYKTRSLDTDSGLGSSRTPTITPDSSRSVCFNIDLPYIDDEIDTFT